MCILHCKTSIAYLTIGIYITIYNEQPGIRLLQQIEPDVYGPTVAIE